MRKFYIEANNGLRYNLQNEKCFLNSPTGLGFSKNTTYATVGNYFIIDNIQNAQKNITGQLVFMGDYYTNFKEFVDFSKAYKEYKLVYDANGTEYYIDIDIVSLSKSDSQRKGCLICDLSFLSKSLFYKKTENKYHLTPSNIGSRWDVDFNFMFTDEIPGQVLVDNSGHVPSSFEFEILGPVENPSLEVYEEGILVNDILFTVTIENGESLIFGNKDNNLYVYIKNLSTGDLTNAFETLDINNENFFKLRVGSSLLSFSGESPIPELSLTTYEEYEAV